MHRAAAKNQSCPAVPQLDQEIQATTTPEIQELAQSQTAEPPQPTSTSLGINYYGC